MTAYLSKQTMFIAEQFPMIKERRNYYVNKTWSANNCWHLIICLQYCTFSLLDHHQ